MMKMPLSHYMDPRLIVFLNADHRDSALHQLVHVIYQAGKLKDEELFYRAIIEREKIVSTGIGMGVAIPHAKLPAYDHFFIAIGILQKPVDWQALDEAPVRLIFMIGGPDDKQTEYLQLLSSLTQAIKDEDKRKKLLNSTDPTDIIELFQTI
ncbi:PTS sugar transporter subunit IIA [Candidatus Protochlamydia phocaeensis]|uniref:PTS sugar transporter subunit IIA n=1 Tax=Candidatus Protochlamydia phocaeensis TaxID=1414722 RepID=UPI000837D6B9|nr:PTS sugar transporter subunit IIA [Candidatus Protochlamydia phocaeensis]